MKCPYCGSEAGYYMYERVHRFLMFSFGGKPIGASEDITDYAGKRKKCIDCNKILPKELFRRGE